MSLKLKHVGLAVVLSYSLSGSQCETTGPGGGGGPYPNLDRSPAPPPLVEPGKWRISPATGHTGKQWKGLMRLTYDGYQDPPYSGEIHWTSEDQRRGVELVRGSTKDEGANHILVLRAYSSSGEIQPATYTAIVSPSGDILSQGEWTGTSDSPGTWSAIWLNNRPLGADEYLEF